MRNKGLAQQIMEAMSLGEIDPAHAYALFAKSYQDATGAAWTEEKFLSRAAGWTFYGDAAGYVAARAQRSGMIKLVGAAGDPRSILRGIEELKATGRPFWGAVSAPLAAMAKKRGLIVPHLVFGGPTLIRALVAMIPDSVFGGHKPKMTKDGGLTFDYPDVGPATKYLIGNKTYFLHALQLPDVKERLKTIPGAGLILRSLGLSSPGIT
jgi:hypothetical protein